MNETRPTSCLFLLVNWEKRDSADSFISNIIACILNLLTSPLTVSGNCVILFAIKKTRELHSPSWVLLGCLAFSDLVVGLTCQPCFVAYVVAELVGSFHAYCPLRVIHVFLGWITAAASFCTLTAVSIDRLLALTLHLRYNAIVTIPRVFLTIFMVWIACAIAVVSRIWIRNWKSYAPGGVLLNLFVTAFSTVKIFQIVKRHQRQINDQNSARRFHTGSVNVLKCRKSAVTVIYVYGLQLLCYLPLCVVILVHTFLGYHRAVKIANVYVTTAVYFNALLNPLVYCWRIREVRRAIKRTLKRNIGREATAEKEIPSSSEKGTPEALRMRCDNQ